MNCPQIKKRLSAFMDNELEEALSRSIAEHLKGCPRCREYLYEFRKIDDLVSGPPGMDPSPDFSRRVEMAAMGASTIVDEESVPFSSRLRFALGRISEEIFSLIPSGSSPSIRTLEEFSDCPPLSLSSIYFKLLEQSMQRMST